MRWRSGCSIGTTTLSLYDVEFDWICSCYCCPYLFNGKTQKSAPKVVAGQFISHLVLHLLCNALLHIIWVLPACPNLFLFIQ
jgi:hypothetical protein